MITGLIFTSISNCVNAMGDARLPSDLNGAGVCTATFSAVAGNCRGDVNCNYQDPAYQAKGSGSLIESGTTASGTLNMKLTTSSPLARTTRNCSVVATFTR